MTTTAESRAGRLWPIARGDRLATLLEPVEVLAVLNDDSGGGARARFVPSPADPLLLEWAAASGLRAEVGRRPSA